jgi:ATP-dependent DNA helicase RecG
MPHFLSMSATPIPRTLSLTLFGDLDLSTITELPVGRKAIITKIVAPANRDKAYQFVREQIQKGRQAFIICPRIEVGKENTSISHLPYLTSHSWADVKAVKEEYEKLSTKIFPDLKIAMLHGKLKAKEKNQIMNDFTENKVNILVATSVVEVGVDIPNASIMIIEGADRFGLAQLYQFRGRVGRASHQSFCLLFTDSISTSTHQRLKSLLEAKNGFELAEKDLAIRGPGEFIGHTQTGMPDLLMRSLNNMELIKEARLAAVEILKKEQGLESYPLLKAELGKFKQRIHLE